MNYRSSNIALYTTAVFLLFLFQNCSQPMPQNGGESINSAVSEDGSYTDTFPFDTKVDQIAMMSCSQNNPADMGYFTIRAGAYHDAGVKLNDSFSSKYLLKSTDQLASLVYNNPLTNEITPRIALVDTETSAPVFQNYLKNKESMSLIGGPLTLFPLFKPIRELKNDQRLRYLNQYEGTGKRNIQGDVLYSGAENNALINSIKDRENMKLAITHGPFSKPELALGSSGYQDQSIDQTFSTIYDIELGPHQVGNSSNPVLKSVKEGETSWSCDEAYKFQIFRMDDVVNSYCTARPDLTENDIGFHAGSTIMEGEFPKTVLTLVSEEHIKLQKVLRRILDPKSENWFIDVINRCIVPKNKSNKNACYEKTTTGGSNDSEYNILYGVANCAVEISNQDGSTGMDYKQCPHYVSLCTSFPLDQVTLE